jgi:hypothetical protein
VRRAREISDRMAIAAARKLAAFAGERGLRDGAILPTMEEWQVYPPGSSLCPLHEQPQAGTTASVSCRSRGPTIPPSLQRR